MSPEATPALLRSENPGERHATVPLAQLRFPDSSAVVTAAKNEANGTLWVEPGSDDETGLPRSVLRLGDRRPGMPRTKSNAAYFLPIERWEGYVSAIGEESFQAQLLSLTQGGPEEFAEFELVDISPGDRELLVEGAVFYWSVGYHISETRQRMKASVVKFRRLPAWQERDMNELRDRARVLAEQFGSRDND